MKKIVVLGAGMVGSAIALDLADEFDVLAVDRDARTLEKLARRGEAGSRKGALHTQAADLADAAALKGVVEGMDLVIGAVPGFMGYETLKRVIALGKNIVDISFFPEAPFGLDEAAREQGVIALVDCGVAPGMSNVILGYHNELMEVEYYECLVGGLPVKRSWPYQYKAPFSPIDVIEEYIRPAVFVERGKVTTRPALTDPEYVSFDPIGTLEAFNTDGLRTLVRTMNVPNMKEKTLRYPGHIEYMRVLRETGFFDKETVEVNGAEVRPLDLTAKLLFPRWELGKEEPEITVMRVTLKGRKDGTHKEYVYNLFDHYDAGTRTSSMARTTGYTCTAAARLVLEGLFDRKGISPPEYLGANPECFERLLHELAARGVNYVVEEK